MSEEINKPTRKEMMDMLEEMIKNIENLPQHALISPITHIDLLSALMLLLSILRSDAQ